MKPFVAGLFISFVAVLSGCGGASAQPEAASAQASAGGDLEAVCRDTFARERTCTDDYIPALVDARIEMDMPAGIAAEAQKNGRDALITQAKAEWSKDSEPAAVAQQCQRMAAKMPAKQKAEVSAALSQCLASSDCKSYVQCVMPITKKILAAPK